MHALGLAHLGVRNQPKSTASVRRGMYCDEGQMRACQEERVTAHQASL